MNRVATLELADYPRRAALMAGVALAALVTDFVSKEIAVALEPDALLFHVSERTVFGLGTSLILVAAATSLLACVLPSRVVALGAGVALGGALGNLTSRTWWSAYGGSPDFIPFADGSTGNVADIFIGMGALAMLLGAVAWLGWNVASALRRPA